MEEKLKDFILGVDNTGHRPGLFRQNQAFTKLRIADEVNRIQPLTLVRRTEEDEKKM